MVKSVQLCEACIEMELDLKKAKNSLIHFELYPYPQIRAETPELR